MTLVLSVHGRDTLWLVVDRRLSYGPRRPPTDDAVKVASLGALDGAGLLAYAGLGATAKGTQPSQWMSMVLRGRAGLSFEESLGVLADAATRELPRILIDLPGNRHSIIAPAFVDGAGRRLYTIDNYVDPKSRQHFYRFTSHQRTAEPGAEAARLALGGTGGAFLEKRQQAWVRPLFRVLKAHDRGQVSAHFVADHLAALNFWAHRGVSDGTVGPRCIVLWRKRDRGGNHQFYTGTARESDSASIPSISNGLDLLATVGIIAKFVTPLLDEALLTGEPPAEPDVAEMNRLLGQMPSTPDEDLR